MKQILTLLCIIIFFSCKKGPHCETWVYYDQCIPKSSTVPGCITGPLVSARFCDQDLNGVSEGASITLQEDADSKHVRHFVSKVP